VFIAFGLNAFRISDNFALSWFQESFEGDDWGRVE